MLAALELMVKYRISGLPVLDDNNRVVRICLQQRMALIETTLDQMQNQTEP